MVLYRAQLSKRGVWRAMPPDTDSMRRCLYKRIYIIFFGGVFVLPKALFVFGHLF